MAPLAPRSLTSGLQNCEGMFLLFKAPVFGTLLGRPWETNAERIALTTGGVHFESGPLLPHHPPKASLIVSG